MTQNQSPKKIDNSDKNNALAQIIALRIDDLLLELEVNLYRSGNKFIGACPIHGGKKTSSLNLWPDGHTVPGLWKCRSHHCEEVFKQTILGFVRGVLSQRKYGWSKQGDREVPFPEAIEWCCNFIGQKLETIKVDEREVERRKFASQIECITKKVAKKEGIPKNLVRSSLSIPAQFFIDRRYSPEILNKYDVGLCDKQGKEMFSRVVVPIYDETKNQMIGCSGRSIYPECKMCECYHKPGEKCPAEGYRWLYSKWKHSANFNTSSCLYNYWNAKKYIGETATVILVEGPADVWRLEEAGIHNSVAIFGCELCDEQQVILEGSGAMSVIILLDNDESGIAGTANLKKILSRAYNVYSPKYEGHDIGENSVENIRKNILPIINEIQMKNKSYSF